LIGIVISREAKPEPPKERLLKKEKVLQRKKESGCS
jgi:hypothetical protein